MTHWISLTLMALVISVVFAFLMREKPKDKLILGLKMFLGLVLFAFIVGWLIYFIP